jgi:AraC-like DNA-binding protein
MGVTFRAADESAASRRDYWLHVVGAALGPVELQIDGPVSIGDELVVGEMGSVRVGALTAREPGGARRSARHVRRSDPEFCKVDVLTCGQGVVEQDGRAAHLRPGDLTLVDFSRPAVWRMQPSTMVAIVFPRSLLPLRPAEMARLTAVRISGDRGAGGLVSSLARQLPDQLDLARESDGVRLGTAVLDLVSVALAARLDRGSAVPSDVRQRALLRRIHAYIDEHLGDSALSPAGVAAAHHISLRYLYKLFEGESDTVAAWIRRRRLERSRRDLLDPGLQVRTVGAIGARWGFVNPAHFNRAFREAYGLPPGEYRATGSGMDNAFFGTVRDDPAAAG